MFKTEANHITKIQVFTISNVILSKNFMGAKLCVIMSLIFDKTLTKF